MRLQLGPAYAAARLPPEKPHELEAEDEGKRALALTLVHFHAIANPAQGVQDL